MAPPPRPRPRSPPAPRRSLPTGPLGAAPGPRQVTEPPAAAAARSRHRPARRRRGTGAPPTPSPTPAPGGAPGARLPVRIAAVLPPVPGGPRPQFPGDRPQSPGYRPQSPGDRPRSPTALAVRSPLPPVPLGEGVRLLPAGWAALNLPREEGPRSANGGCRPRQRAGGAGLDPRGRARCRALPDVPPGGPVAEELRTRGQPLPLAPHSVCRGRGEPHAPFFLQGRGGFCQDKGRSPACPGSPQNIFVSNKSPARQLQGLGSRRWLRWG